MRRIDYAGLDQLGQRRNPGVQQCIPGRLRQDDLVVIDPGHQRIMLDEPLVEDVRAVDPLDRNARNRACIIILVHETGIDELPQRYQARIEQIVQRDVPVIDQVERVQLRRRDHPRRVQRRGTQGLVHETIPPENPLLGHLRQHPRVADDQIVHVQQAQVHQVADIDDLDKVVQVHLVGRDVVVQIAVLEKDRILEVPDIQPHRHIDKVALTQEPFLHQSREAHLVVIKGHKAVQGNRTGVVVADVQPAEPRLQLGDRKLDIVEIVDVDELLLDVLGKRNVVQYRAQQRIEPHGPHVNQLVQFAVLKQRNLLHRLVHDRDCLERALLVYLIYKGVAAQQPVLDHVLERTVRIQQQVLYGNPAVIVTVQRLISDILLADHVRLQQNRQVHRRIGRQVALVHQRAVHELPQAHHARFPEIIPVHKPRTHQLVFADQPRVEKLLQVDRPDRRQPGIEQGLLAHHVAGQQLAKLHLGRRQLTVGNDAVLG